MKRNRGKKTNCKTIAMQKNGKNRKSFRTGVKAAWYGYGKDRDYLAYAAGAF